jgi:hypothetical protein
MHSTEERVIAIKRRIKEIGLQKQLCRGRVMGIFAVAACLTIVLGLSFAFPKLKANMPNGEYNYFGAAGSILDGGGTFSFLIIGLISFVLGVCVTILCHRIHLKSKNSKGNMEDNEE